MQQPYDTEDHQRDPHARLFVCSRAARLVAELQRAGYILPLARVAGEERGRPASAYALSGSARLAFSEDECLRCSAACGTWKAAGRRCGGLLRMYSRSPGRGLYDVVAGRLSPRAKPPRESEVIQRADQCTNFAMVNANAADASTVATIHFMIAVSTAATSALTWPTAALTSATSAFVAR
jgi:hypothetical protein